MRYFANYSEVADDGTTVQLPPRPPDTGGDILPFEHLGDRRFEILAYRLKCSSYDETGYRVALMKGVGERGRDVVVYSAEGRVVEIAQCKNLRDRLSAPTLRRELLKLAIHHHLDKSILGEGKVKYELWCPGDLTEPAADFLNTWPRQWTPQNLADDASIVLNEYASFRDLKWESIGEQVAAHFRDSVAPVYFGGVAISVRVRQKHEILETFFQAKIVMDRADVLDAVRQTALAFAQEKIEQADKRAAAAIAEAQEERNLRLEETSRGDRLAYGLAISASRAANAGFLAEARAEFMLATNGPAHPATLFLAFEFFLRNGDIALAEELASRALSHPNQDTLIRAGAMLDLGVLYAHGGQLSKAEQMYVDCRQLYQQINEQAGEAAVTSELGLLYSLLGDFTRAEEMHSKALSLYVELGAISNVAHQYTNLGSLYRAKGDLRRASVMHVLALRVYKQLHHEEGVANASSNIAVLYALRSHYDAAERLHRKALNIFQKLGHKKHIAIQYGALGIIRKHYRQLNASEDMQRMALSMNREIENAEGVARDLGNLAMVRAELGALDEAERLCFEALAIDERLQSPRGIAGTYGNLAIIAKMRGDFTYAAEWQTKAVQLFETVGDKNGVGINYVNLAHILREQGQLEPIRDCLRKAVDAFTAGGNVEHASRQRAMLGLELMRRGDIDEAQQVLEEATAMLERLETPEPLAIIALADVYAQRQELNRAEEMLDKVGTPDGSTVNNYCGVYLKIAGARMQLEQLGEAERVCRTVLLFAKEYPDIAVDASAGISATHQTLGNLLLKYGEQSDSSALYREACEHLAEAERIGPNPSNTPKLLYLWGIVLCRLVETEAGGNRPALLEEACAKLSGARALDPGNADYACLYADTLLDLSSFKLKDEAIMLLQLARTTLDVFAKQKPAYPAVWEELGYVLARLADFTDDEHANSLYEEAEAALECSLKLEPSSARALSIWANMLAKRARAAVLNDVSDELFSATSSKWGAALELGTGSFDILCAWGLAQAIQAERSTPTEALVLLSGATAKFREARRTKPEDLEARHTLARILLQRASRDSTQQIAFVAEARQLVFGSAVSDVPTEIYERACFHALFGEEEDARRYLERLRGRGLLPAYDEVARDPDLAQLASRQWFTELFGTREAD